MALLTETLYPGPDLVVGRGGRGTLPSPRGGRRGGKGGRGVPCPPSVVGSLLFSSCKKRNFVLVFMSFFVELESIEKSLKILVVGRGDPGTPAPDPKPWWWW